MLLRLVLARRPCVTLSRSRRGEVATFRFADEPANLLPLLIERPVLKRVLHARQIGLRQLFRA